MNEVIFIGHVLAVMGFALVALRLGRAALIVWVAVQAICANLFVTKQIELFGFTVTSADVFAIGGMLGLNLLQEYFGKESAKKAIWICFYFMLFFAAMSQIHLLYAPSRFDTAHLSFANILAPAPRLFFASLSVFFIVQQVDLRLFGYLKRKFPFIIRNGVSLTVSQFLDTVLFSLIGLAGLVESLAHIIFISFLLKMAIIACATPLSLLARRVLRV